MTNPLKHFEDAARHIRLSSEERLYIRERLRHHILLHPLAPIPSPYQRYFKAPAFTFAALLLVIIGGGGALAAKGALPGEPLYRIKVGIVEPVEGAFHVTQESRAKWQVHLATTRLMEAEDLRAAGTLTSGNATELGARFAHSASQAATEVEALVSHNPAVARSAAHDLDSSLSEHTRAVASLTAAGDASTTPVLAALLSTSAADHGRDNHPAARAPAPLTASTTTEASINTSSTPPGDHPSSDDRYNRSLQLFAHVHALAGENDVESNSK